MPQPCSGRLCGLSLADTTLGLNLIPGSLKSRGPLEKDPGLYKDYLLRQSKET